MGSTTDHETSSTHEIFSYSILVHTLLSSQYNIKDRCWTTFLRVTIRLHISVERIRSISFRYPDDEYTYNIDQQFLVGSAILVSPNLVSVRNIVFDYWIFECLELHCCQCLHSTRCLVWFLIGCAAKNYWTIRQFNHTNPEDQCSCSWWFHHSNANTRS